MALVIIANVALRGRPWVHEWFWAFFNYHFVTIFLGPLAAGLGAWEGARLTPAADLLVSSGGQRRALRAAWAGVVAWIGAVYLAGLVGIVALVKSAGTPGSPNPIALSTLAPALAFVAMWVAVGAAAGWKLGSRLAAPLVAVGAFAAILVLYVVNYDLVRVGGATASLLGLAPRPELQAAQIAIYAGVAAGALLLVPRLRPAPAGDRLDRLGVVAGAGAAVIAGAVLVVPGPDFRLRPEPEVCTGTPAICLAGGYRAKAREVREILAPYLSAATHAGVPLPERFVQDYDRSRADLVGWISPNLARGEDPTPYYAVLDAYVSETCGTFDDKQADEYYGGLIFFFDRAGDVGEFDLTEVEVLNTGSPDEQAAWVRMAVDYLRHCP
ncbi:MAG: hypothetical protein ACRD0C_12245 [Acidimicrobiia bacterium]